MAVIHFIHRALLGTNHDRSVIKFNGISPRHQGPYMPPACWALATRLSDIEFHDSSMQFYFPPASMLTLNVNVEMIEFQRLLLISTQSFFYSKSTKYTP